MKLDPCSKRTAWLMMLLGSLMIWSVLTSVILAVIMLWTKVFIPMTIPFFVCTILLNYFGFELSGKLEKKRIETQRN